MTLHLLATTSAETEGAEEQIAGFPPQALALGGAAFVVFLILLFVVTRLNVTR
jgi:hypothetical protein